MELEKFSQNGVSGIRFKNATFASSRNRNGCNFDPLEVFSVDKAPADFNKNHLQNSTLKAEFETPIKAEFQGKLIKFSADIVSFDPYVVANAEKVSGFSPELQPVRQPARRDDERFYSSGDLRWERTAILFGTKPGFVGADKFDIEKFSVLEDVVIEEFTAKEEVKKQEQPVTEKFTSQELSRIQEIMEENFEKLKTDIKKVKLEMERFMDEQEERNKNNLTENFAQQQKGTQGFASVVGKNSNPVPTNQVRSQTLEEIRKKLFV